MAVDMLAADPSPSEAARSAEDAQRVQDALATLPDEPDRLIVNMHFVHDLSLTEIAKALGLSLDEVRRVYRRSMRHLETLLADGEVDPIRDEMGFYGSRHPVLHPLESTLPGVFLAGTCQGPRDIAETVCQGSGVAARVIRLLTELDGET